MLTEIHSCYSGIISFFNIMVTFRYNLQHFGKVATFSVSLAMLGHLHSLLLYRLYIWKTATASRKESSAHLIFISFTIVATIFIGFLYISNLQENCNRLVYSSLGTFIWQVSEVILNNLCEYISSCDQQ